MTVVAAVHVVTAVSAAVRLVSVMFPVSYVRLVPVVVTVMIHVSAVAFGSSRTFVCVMRGVLGRALPAAIGMLSAFTVFVVSAVLLARPMGPLVTMVSMPCRGVVAARPSVLRMLVVLSVIVTRRFPVPKLSESAIEDLGGLPGVLDLHPGLGRRDGAPQIRCPAALFVALLGVMTAQNHQQIRLRGRTHARPPPTNELRLHRQPLPGGSRGHRQQNSRPGHRCPQEPAPQLHRKAPSRQA